jgi:hypothetical protein
LAESHEIWRFVRKRLAINTERAEQIDPASIGDYK